MATGIAMQGISAAIVIEAINKIGKMISDADAMMADKIEPAINNAIDKIPNRPDALKANYSDSRSAAAGALGGASVVGSGPNIAPPPALIESAVVSFFEDYTTVIDELFPGLSQAANDADAFISAALASVVGVSYSEQVDRSAAETAFALARKQAHAQEREVLDAASAAGHRFAPGTALNAIARLHAESTRAGHEAIVAAHAARLQQERSDKMRLVRSQIDMRMDRVRKLHQQTAEAFRLKLKARGMWINDQNAVIDATNSQYAINAQFQARVAALLKDVAARRHNSAVSALEIGDRKLDIGRLKMMNGQELVDLLGQMVGTLLNQIRANGSYNGTERDVTDWDSILA